MTENLKNITTQLIENYIQILKENGEPGEAYKYLAFNTFRQNWKLEHENFFEMLQASFSKVGNLLYQNSRDFIEKASQLFPEDTKEMFRKLYDESLEVSQRIKTFQEEAEQLLPKVRQALNRDNINAQQDERTISLYLALRYPEKYILYKAEYYKSLCANLNIKIKITGQRFLHLQELAGEIIQKGLLEDEDFINTYREYYPKPDWEDQYLMIQNILFVVSRKNIGAEHILTILKNFDRKELEDYYSFLDKIIEKFNLQQNDQRLVFNFRKNRIACTVGQRYIFRVRNNKSKEMAFGIISTDSFTSHYSGFDGTPVAYWNETDQISEIIRYQHQIFEAIEKELKRAQISGYLKNNKKELEQMAFDLDYRNEILNQLTYKTTPEKAMENMNNDKKIPLNQILFGAPGTGKTHKLINEYFDLFTVKESSLTKEQFLVSFVTDLNWWQVITLALIDLQKAKVTEIHEHPIVKAKEALSNSKTVRPTLWGQLQAHTVKDCPYVNVEKRQDPLYFYKDENSFWTIKENLLNELYPEATQLLASYNDYQPSPDKLIRNYEFVTFHQSFSYEDFIEGIKPNLNTENTELTYKIEDGVFKQLCNKAKRDPNNKYALFIDEINRGNVSAIFGELITLIEETKRAGNEDAVEITLPYSKDKFSVPNNVYIIGTMNTADRSVEALDTALRRRFSFIEMQPEPNILVDSEYKDVDLKQLLVTINQRIEVLIDKDHQIGHSYFIGIRSLEDLKNTFRDKIIPLLEEYFYGDFGKIGLVLGGNFIYPEENNAKFPKNFTYENEFLEDKKLYHFIPSENWNVRSFISVYED